MKNNHDAIAVGLENKDHDNIMGTEQPETIRHRWVSPQLKEFGNLSFVVKGISYNPSDGLTNLTP